MKLELDRRGFNAGTFQLLLKGCTIEASWNGILLIPVIDVSVVVERMYD